MLRGAGAMLFGRGQADGVIDQVSKTPLRIEQYTLSGSIGSDDYREPTADLNKPLGGTALRVNLMQRDKGSWRSNPATGSEPDLHRKGIGLSLALNQDGNSRFWLDHYWLKNDDNPDYGISFDSATRRPNTRFAAETFLGTDATFDQSETQISTLVHEYRISPTTQWRHADYERSYWARTPSPTIAPNAQATRP